MSQEALAQLSQLETLLASLISAVPRISEALLGFETFTDLQLDEALTVGMAEGRRVQVLEHGGVDLVEAGGGAWDYEAASGARFRVRMDRGSPMYFGAVGGGVVDDTAALDKVDASDAIEIDLLGRRYRYTGSWSPTKPVYNGSVTDDDGTREFTVLTGVAIATQAEALAQLTPDTEGKLATLQAVAAMITAALSGSAQTVEGRLIVVGSTSGSRVAGAWTTRALDTVDENSITGASLANNQIILPAGRYRLTAQAQFSHDPVARIRFRDLTNAATLGFISVDDGASNAAVAAPTVTTEVVLAAETTVELQYLSSIARADGLGAGAATTPARYAVIEAIKIG